MHDRQVDSAQIAYRAERQDGYDIAGQRRGSFITAEHRFAISTARSSQAPATRRPAFRLVAALLATTALLPGIASADEGGLSFWLPGLNGSFAAVPGTPGWNFSAVYYHSSVSAGGNVGTPRGGQVDLGLQGRGNLIIGGVTYIFDEQVLGAQPAISLFGLGGRNKASVDATLTGPNGGQISGHRSEALTAFGDLIPQVSLKWNRGVHNYMTYLTGDIPVGAYNPDRLANLGLGHGAIDFGGGYTYLNPKTGLEFSMVAGLTYNFENPDTNYQNGIDGHIDWALSQFLNEHVHVGVAGYLLHQLTGDSGEGATLGDFKSQVAGIGPQIGYKFDVSDNTAGYVNLKGYYEFASKNRPDGWNLWLSLAFSPAPPKPVQ